ncbi:MAG: hypothetical protein ABR507_05970 [Actinomycetota bacterium]|nr:hypothetical protein [Actinomycetota bacterium]
MDKSQNGKSQHGTGQPGGYPHGQASGVAGKTDAAFPGADAISLEFDPRLADVWLALFSSKIHVDDELGALGWILRMAYLRGYEDALVEPKQGELFTNLGLPVPVRHRPAKRKERSR